MRWWENVLVSIWRATTNHHSFETSNCLLYTKLFQVETREVIQIFIARFLSNLAFNETRLNKSPLEKEENSSLDFYIKDLPSTGKRLMEENIFTWPKDLIVDVCHIDVVIFIKQISFPWPQIRRTPSFHCLADPE